MHHRCNAVYVGAVGLGGFAQVKALNSNLNNCSIALFHVGGKFFTISEYSGIQHTHSVQQSLIGMLILQGFDMIRLVNIRAVKTNPEEIYPIFHCGTK